MALYAHIVDGNLVEVGPLPVSAERVDTGDVVYDLFDTGAKWRQACGWYDVDTLDVNSFNLSHTDRDILQAAVTVAVLKRDRRTALETQLANLTDLARDQNWDWIDANCHATVAQIPFVEAQSPNAGIVWGGLSQLQRAEQLQIGVSLALVELIRISQAIDLFADVLATVIAYSDVDPSADR